MQPEAIDVSRIWEIYRHFSYDLLYQFNFKVDRSDPVKMDDLYRRAKGLSNQMLNTPENSQYPNDSARKQRALHELDLLVTNPVSDFIMWKFGRPPAPSQDLH